MPHKYANARKQNWVIWGPSNNLCQGNIFSTFAKGGLAFMKKDFNELARLMIDAEMKNVQRNQYTSNMGAKP